MLYLVATPIGNLADITFRAIETLKNCDYILCEDTRLSRVLLNHYQLNTPLKSYHQFSEAAQEDHIIEDLKNGKNISLISDAGTPGISDPGMRLVKRCREDAIRVEPIPGPCAAIAAISASGLETDLFQFMGFLPRKTEELKTAILSILHYPGTTICYESPKRLEETLLILQKLAPQRKISVARELTKKFEEFLLGTPHEILNGFEDRNIKGEITLLIAGDQENTLNSWKELTPQEHVHHLMDAFELSEKDAIKLAATLRGTPKKEIYKLFF